MDVDIAKNLGEILAFQSEALAKDPHDEDALNRTLLISKVYANFVNNGFESFKEEFEVGYHLGQREGRIDRNSKLDRGVEIGKMIDGPAPST